MAKKTTPSPKVTLDRFSTFFRNVHGSPAVEKALRDAAASGKLRVTVDKSTVRELALLAKAHPELDQWIIDLTDPEGSGG